MFFRCNGGDTKGMDLRRHEISNGLIDQAVALKGFLVGKPGGDDHDGEMTATPAGTGVSGMAVRIIDDFQMYRRQSRAEPFPDKGNSIHRSG